MTIRRVSATVLLYILFILSVCAKPQVYDVLKYSTRAWQMYGIEVMTDWQNTSMTITIDDEDKSITLDKGRKKDLAQLKFYDAPYEYVDVSTGAANQVYKCYDTKYNVWCQFRIVVPRYVDTVELHLKYDYKEYIYKGWLRMERIDY